MTMLSALRVWAIKERLRRMVEQDNCTIEEIREAAIGLERDEQEAQEREYARWKAEARSASGVDAGAAGAQQTGTAK
jgi:low affinity Fe/Cu permease